MAPPDSAWGRERVLVLAPTAADAAFSETVLGEAGLACRICQGFDEVRLALAEGAGAILLTEAAFLDEDPAPLLQGLKSQPEWSDIPVLLLTGGGPDAPAAPMLLDLLGNATVLDRPVRIITLISALRSAIRARHRQYELRDRLETQRRTEATLRNREDALEESVRRKDEFLATLAHELRNPLAPIRSSLNLLQRSGEPASSDPKVIHMVERQVDHMVRLVDDLLEVSRISRGTVLLQKEPVELATIVDTALESCAPFIEAQGHRLHVSVPEHPMTLLVDPVRITQIVANLLNNAAKYTPEGGDIWLHAQGIPAGETAPAEIVISVRDTGVGIPPGMLKRVFDMFNQVDRSTTRSQGGLGIGLALVQGLVQLHGGSVEARSEGSGRGSEFIVRLPVAGAEAADEGRGKEVSPGLGSLASRPILVVDDNVDAADSLGMLLELLGASVFKAHDGASALEQVIAHHPDVVLLDLGMPGMSGYEVARRIRERPELKDTVLIALTGWGSESDRQRSQGAGIDYHLVKPVEFEALSRLLVSLPAGTTRV